MKRASKIVLLLCCALALSFAVRQAWKTYAKRLREKAYQQALRSYAETFRPGMTRKAVETALRLRNLQFESRCCIYSDPGDSRAYADLVKVGNEDPPWFCNEVNVYIVFQFVAANPNLPGTDEPTDTLKRLLLRQQPEVCL